MLLRPFVTGSRQMLPCNLSKLKGMTTTRYMHITTGTKRAFIKHNFTLNNNKYTAVAGTLFIRHASTDGKTVEILPDTEIPDAPTPIIETISDTVEKVLALHPNGEPTLASLGLGGYTPTGMVQSCLEWLHISCNLPWFAAIMTGTVIIRIVLLPLLIKSQRMSAELSNYMPKVKALQEKLTEARRTGDYVVAAETATELATIVQSPGFKPFQAMLLPMAQVPVFISVFLALNKMTQLPVESMRHGGILWFKDLVSADPYYLLPVLTCLTTFVAFKCNADGVLVSTSKIYAYGHYIIPAIAFPFMISFPAALNCYWMATNVCTLAIVMMIRTKKGKEFFKIPDRRNPNIDLLRGPKKSFVEGFRSSIEDFKFTRRLEEKLQADQVRYYKEVLHGTPKPFVYKPKNKSSTTTETAKDKR